MPYKANQARRHRTVDLDSSDILVCELTDKEQSDTTQVGNLLDPVSGDIALVATDSAYDGDPVYRAVVERAPEADVIIPARPSHPDQHRWVGPDRLVAGDQLWLQISGRGGNVSRSDPDRQEPERQQTAWTNGRSMDGLCGPQSEDTYRHADHLARRLRPSDNQGHPDFSTNV